MTAKAQTQTPSDQALRNAFDEILEYQAQRRSLNERIAETVDSACAAIGISKKGFKLALKWYSMTDGERDDFNEALQAAQRVMDKSGTNDMFSKKPRLVQ